MIQLNILCHCVSQYGMISKSVHACVTPATSKHENFVFQEVPFLEILGFLWLFMFAQLLTDDE